MAAFTSGNGPSTPGGGRGQLSCVGRGVNDPGGGGRGLSAEGRGKTTGLQSSLCCVQGAGLPIRPSFGAQSQRLIRPQVDGTEHVIYDETIAHTY